MADIEQRVQNLEMAINRLQVLHEQSREVLKSRFEALSKGQDILVIKIDGFRDLVNQLAGDAASSPAGRAIQSSILALQEASANHHVQLDAMMTFENRVLGVLGLLKWIGAASILLALMSILRVFGIWR